MMREPHDLPEKSSDENLENDHGKRSSSTLNSLRSFSSDTQHDQGENQRDVVPSETKPSLFSLENLRSDAGCIFLFIALYAAVFIILVLINIFRITFDPGLVTGVIFIGLPLVIMPIMWGFYRLQNPTFAPNPNYITDLDPREADAYPRATQRVYEPAKPHAVEAVRTAGLDPDELLPAQPIDIGVIAFWGEHTVHAHRTVAVPISADSLQPYIELEMRQAGRWNVEFEILDNNQQTLFKHAINVDLPLSQRLLLTPPARLSLQGVAPDDTWTLRVCVNDRLVADHRFTWRSDDIDSLAGNIDSDGEIDESILPLLANNYAQPMSLDDLLASGENNLSSTPKTSRQND